MIYYVVFNTLISIFLAMIWNSKDWVNFLIKMVFVVWMIINCAFMVGLLQPMIADSGMKLF